jgi:hypothetical protein
MKLLKPATNKMAYAKIGIYGFGGAGKTRTASEIMIGLYKYLLERKQIKPDMPLAFIDTETGSDFLIPLFEKNGIKIVSMKTRSFTDMMKIIDEAEKECFGLVIDSITHIWRDLVESYQEKLTKRRKYKKLAFHDWNIIKPIWHEYADKFVNSKLHIVICGRAGWDYEYLEDENGQRELQKTSTKMKAETEFQFEPSLVIEMEAVHQAKGEIGSKLVRKAHIIKDRNPFNSIDGKIFTNPTFKNFKPFFDNLNIGNDHVGVENRNSTELFDDNGNSEWELIKKRKTIALEKIEEGLKYLFPAATGKDKTAKLAILKELTGTFSWAEITSSNIESLEMWGYYIDDLALAGQKDKSWADTEENIIAKVKEIASKVYTPNQSETSELPFE